MTRSILTRPTHHLIDRFHSTCLAGLGLISIIVYAYGLAARYPLIGGLANPNIIWSSMVGRSAMAFSVHALVYLFLILLYLLAIWLIRRATSNQQAAITIIGVWLLASIALLGTAPGGESHDIFDYIYRGRMLAIEQISPLAVTPDSAADRLFYRYISWGGVVDTYGPLWEYASAATALATHTLLDSIGLRVSNASACSLSPSMCTALAASIIGYRLLAIALTGLSGYLIAALVRHHSPNLVPAALLIWFWNPLLLISTALGAHNDALMLPIILAALLAIQRQHWLLALLVLALAVHVKLTALLFVPPILFWLIWQVGWWGAIWRGVCALAIALPISWALYVPLGGWATLPRMLEERSRYLANSIARIGYVVLQDLLGWNQPAAVGLATNAANWMFLAIAAMLMIRMLDLPRLVHWQGTEKRPTNDAILWTSICAVVLAYLLIGSFWFQPWYLTWLLAPAALLPFSRLTSTILPWYCLGALCSNLLSDFFFYEQRTAWTRTNQISLIVATMLIPMLLAVAVMRWRDRHHSDETGGTETLAQSQTA
ncbi:MAG: hypothetical protein SH847_16510 [Roseiflexaceae bacterium]|nr:hypothetical protein [Roseiflexaceae bacterium]